MLPLKGKVEWHWCRHRVFLFCRRRVSQGGPHTVELRHPLFSRWYVGTAYGIAAAAGLRGQKAANTVFATVYTGDVVLNTALGLYKPTQWSRQCWVIDIVDKYVQAQATRAIFDRFLDPAGQS